MRTRKSIVVGAMFCMWLASAHAADSKRVDNVRAVPPSAISVAPLLGARGVCVFEPLGGSLTVAEAAARALCNNPQTRKAWASLLSQLAVVGMARSAYYPTLSMSGNFGKSQTSTKVEQLTQFDSDVATEVYGGAANLGFTLFDSGLRKSRLERAEQLAAAANALDDATAIEVFLNAAQAYFNVVDAQASLDFARRSESLSLRTFEVASARNRGGVGLLTDQLQAQTSHLQAKLRRAEAEATLASVRGTLAVQIGMDANAPFELGGKFLELPTSSFLDSIEKLIEVAKRDHPRMAAARAQVNASQAAIDAAAAQGLPTLVLSATSGRTEQSLSRPRNVFSVIDVPSDNSTRNDSIQLRINVPLFDGFNRAYAVRQARAQAYASKMDLESVEQELTLEIWRSYHLVVAQSQNIETTLQLVEVAGQSVRATEERYQAGTGSIIEVLNAQSALDSAERQRIRSLASWRAAKLSLAAGLGKIGLWALD